jgi:hypothetical protein
VGGRQWANGRSLDRFAAFDRCPFEQKVPDGRNKSRMSAGRRSAHGSHLESFRRGKRFAVEVVHHFHVVGDEADRCKHNGPLRLQ